LKIEWNEDFGGDDYEDIKVTVTPLTGSSIYGVAFEMYKGLANKGAALGALQIADAEIVKGGAPADGSAWGLAGPGNYDVAIKKSEFVISRGDYADISIEALKYGAWYIYVNKPDGSYYSVEGVVQCD